MLLKVFDSTRIFGCLFFFKARFQFCQFAFILDNQVLKCSVDVVDGDIKVNDLKERQSSQVIMSLRWKHILIRGGCDGL